jgi:hypothetical protein
MLTESVKKKIKEFYISVKSVDAIDDCGKCLCVIYDHKIDIPSVKFREVTPLQDQDETYYMRKCDLLEKELEELRKDRERLEWVIRYSGRVSLNWGIATEHKNFREAIDAAMRSEK